MYRNNLRIKICSLVTLLFVLSMCIPFTNGFAALKDGEEGQIGSFLDFSDSALNSVPKFDTLLEGTQWKLSKGNADLDAMIVQDPEDPENKVLRLTNTAQVAGKSATMDAQAAIETNLNGKNVHFQRIYLEKYPAQTAEIMYTFRSGMNPDGSGSGVFLHPVKIGRSGSDSTPMMSDSPLQTGQWYDIYIVFDSGSAETVTNTTALPVTVYLVNEKTGETVRKESVVRPNPGETLYLKYPSSQNVPLFRMQTFISGGTQPAGSVQLMLDALNFYRPIDDSFRMVHSSPENGEENVSSSTGIELEFNIDPAPDMLDRIVLCEDGNPLDMSDYIVKQLPNRKVQISLSASYNGGMLKKGREYSVLLSGLEDVFGQELDSSEDEISFFVTENIEPPVVTVSGLMNGAVVRSADALITTEVLDIEEVGIDRVEYYDGDTLLYTSTEGEDGYPYTWSGEPGIHNIYAVAYYNAPYADVSGQSSEYTVTVQENQKPRVDTAYPTDNAKIPYESMMYVKGSISDTDDVAEFSKVKSLFITVDGTPLSGYEPYEYTGANNSEKFLAELNLDIGEHTVEITAVDIEGLESDAETLNLTVYPQGMTTLTETNFNKLDVSSGYSNGVVEHRSDMDNFCFMGKANAKLYGLEIPDSESKNRGVVPVSGNEDGVDRAVRLDMEGDDPYIETDTRSYDMSGKIRVAFNVYLEPTGREGTLLNISFMNSGTYSGGTLKSSQVLSFRRSGGVNELLCGTKSTAKLEFNTWYNVNCEIDTEAELMDLYLDGERIAFGEALPDSDFVWDLVNAENTLDRSIKIRFAGVSGYADKPLKLWIDDFTFGKIVEGADIDFVQTVDQNGNISTDPTDAGALMKQIVFEASEALNADSLTANVTLVRADDGTQLNFTGELDSTKKLYTVTVNDRVDPGTEYKLKFASGVETESKTRLYPDREFVVKTAMPQIYVTSQGFYTNSGELVTDLSEAGNTLTAKASVKLNSISSADVTVMAVLYQNNGLSKVWYNKQRVSTNSTEITTSVDLSGVDTSDAVLRLYVVDNVKDMTPLSRFSEI